MTQYQLTGWDLSELLPSADNEVVEQRLQQLEADCGGL